jgi:serine/threonine-protein kinase
MIGKQLGSHEITALLGKGGMGEVYRARDTRLKREVAIKILPEDFSRDKDRVNRFQREAEVLASLNHPNIAAIYDLQEADEIRFLVLELVEGETLAERIQRGRIPVEEALDIAKRICEALEAAHEKGIVHRDLKPANVKITPDGKIKVLDFGLAKALELTPSTSNLMSSPTLMSALPTGGGIILGTAGYMSPEQAKGAATDQRSDIFSFGCVLFEMLTGHRSFEAETVPETIAAVLMREPDLTLLPRDIHPKLKELIRRCLAKNRKERWHAIADVRVDIESIMADPHGQQVPATGLERRPVWKRMIPVAIAVVLAAVAMRIVDRNTAQAPPPPAITRFPILLPEGQLFGTPSREIVAISPDGTSVVFAAASQLYLRTMHDIEARPLPGTEGRGQVVNEPFFSPDGKWIGFYSGSETRLKKIALTGGAPQVICEHPGPYGVSWGPNDQIFIGDGRKGILRVAAKGGKPETIVKVEPSEIALSPQLLPGDEFLLFTVANGFGLNRWDTAKIVLQSLKTGERRVLFEGGSNARYLPTGHIVYAFGSTLLAVPFDIHTLQLTGQPVSIVDSVMRTGPGGSGAAQFAFSENGTMIYVSGDASKGIEGRVLTFVDRAGNRTPINIPPGIYNDPRISPDGKQLAMRVQDATGENIWIYDLNGAAAPRRLTFEGTRNTRPTWTPNGQRIVFSSNREGPESPFWQPVGGGPAERLLMTDPNTVLQPESISRDGKMLTFTMNPGATPAIWALWFGTDQRPKQLVRGAANSNISPDGRWIAYWSNDGGPREIYVQPFPQTGEKHQVSNTGNTHYPLWSPDGKQLFYVVDQPAGTGQIVSVDVQTQPRLVFGQPKPLPIEGIVFNGPRGYDITPDGKRFIVMLPKSQTDTAAGTQREQINVTLNWFRELQERVPVK